MEKIILCEMCGDKIHISLDNRMIGKWYFHLDCYEAFVYRLKGFIELLTLPQDEYDQWLEAVD